MEYTLHIYVDLNLANRPQRHQINKCISTTELIFQLQNATNSTAANATTAEQTSNSPQHLKAELMERQGPLFVAEKAEILHLFRFSAGDIWKSQRNSLNTGNGSVEIFVGISESWPQVNGDFEDLYTPAMQVRTLPYWRVHRFLGVFIYWRCVFVGVRKGLRFVWKTTFLAI